MSFVPCLNTSTIQPASIPVKIDVAQKSGFKAIELWCTDLKEYVDQGNTLGELGQTLKRAELEVPCLAYIGGCIGCPTDERSERREEALRRLALVSDLGAKCVSCTPSRTPSDVATAVRDYRELLSMARDFGLRVAFECLAFNAWVNGIPKAWEIVERADDADGCLIVDVFHLICGQTTALEDLQRVPAECIANVHLNDVRYTKPFGELRDEDRVYPGDGQFPLNEFFDALRSIGYDRTVSLELFNEELWRSDPYEVGRTGFEKCQRWLN